MTIQAPIHATTSTSTSSKATRDPTAREASHRGFAPGPWQERIDVRDFIQRNLAPYHGDERFLAGPTDRTLRLLRKLQALFVEERARGGVLGVSQVPSSITAHGPGYVDRDDEIIVGLQTDAPLVRAIFPNGGYRMVEASLQAYGHGVDPRVTEVFTKHRKTHNDGVFDVYTKEILDARRSHVVTGLPDAYGRGRIIGDYRRVALYGVDRLIAVKQQERRALDDRPSTDEIIRDREELAEQIRALKELVTMAASYGHDVTRPARNAREAVQWLYFAYLAAVKEQNGAAMSLGRTSTFLDAYFERDLREGTLDERGAQEIVDDFVLKLRIVRFLRTKEYDALFSGDPTWVTEAIGGVATDGRPLVTRTSFRFLHTLETLGPAPEPNLTVLWSPALPEGFKRYCARLSIETSSIQYESDDLMRPRTGDDTAIACCVSAMELGKQMQLFGARVNLAKALLYAINGGRDEISGQQIGPVLPPLPEGELDYETVRARFGAITDWLARVYVDAMNCIHYMHDKYAYERIEMALHDYAPARTMAFGIAGLSIVADSLSAIRHARVRPIRDARGIVVDYEVSGDFPRFGNDDDRVDQIAVEIVRDFLGKLRSHPTYRGATHTQSVLTITSNVVYGKNTGATPDGRRGGEPFAPGANPMHGRDDHGLLAAAFSVAKIPYADAQDGISWTMSTIPTALGQTEGDRITNLVTVLDAYFARSGFHVNVNVLDRAMLLDAMEHPERHPELTIRVSGYAVNFVKLTREQQLDVVGRTFHGRT